MWVKYDMDDINCQCCSVSCCDFFHNNHNISVYLVISQSWTPLHYAADSSSDACCKALLDHNADIEAKDENVSVSS